MIAMFVDPSGNLLGGHYIIVIKSRELELPLFISETHSNPFSALTFSSIKVLRDVYRSYIFPLGANVEYDVNHLSFVPGCCLCQVCPSKARP